MKCIMQKMDGSTLHLTVTVNYDTLGSTQNGLSLVRVFSQQADATTTTTTTTPGINGTIQGWIDQAVNMLQRQWPRDTSSSVGESYSDKLVHSCQGNHGNYELPCSYLLLQGNNACVG